MRDGCRDARGRGDSERSLLSRVKRAEAEALEYASILADVAEALGVQTVSPRHIPLLVQKIRDRAVV